MAIKRENQEKYVNIEYRDGAAWIRGPLLGKGSYGRVYKATLKNNHRSKYYGCFPSEMAVKSAEVSVCSTLEKEKDIISNLNECPYVIKCFGEETTMSFNGVLVYNLLLEYASGGTLADRIRKSGGKGLSELEVRAHTRSILRCLNYIHGLGYVHCDLKPDNVLLVPNCGKGRNIITEFRAKIGDFGLAKKRNSVPYPRGTPMYLSPETVIDYVQEAPCDIWALGCIVLEMLTGKRTWEGKKEEILRRIGAEDELPKIPKEVSEDARHFLMCCFERKSIYRLTSELLLDHPYLDALGNFDDDKDQLEDSESKVVMVSADQFSCAEIESFVGPSTKVVYFDQANEILSKEMFSQNISERIIQFVLPFLE